MNQNEAAFKWSLKERAYNSGHRQQVRYLVVKQFTQHTVKSAVLMLCHSFKSWELTQSVLQSRNQRNLKIQY